MKKLDKIIICVRMPILHYTQVYTEAGVDFLTSLLRAAFTHFQPKYEIKSSTNEQETVALVTISLGGKGKNEELEELAQILELPVLLERLNLMQLPVLKLEYFQLGDGQDKMEPTLFVSFLAYYLCTRGVSLMQHYSGAELWL